MTEQQQYRIIADRDKGGDPRWSDIQTGDRYLVQTTSKPLDWGDVVRIERPVPTTDEQQRRFRVVDIDQGVIDEGNNEVTFALSELDEQPSPHPPTREQIADEVTGIVIGSGYYSTSIHHDEALEVADAVLALIQKRADR